MIRINLLPRAPRRRFPARLLLEVVVPAVTLVVVVVWAVALNRQVADRRTQLTATEQEITALRPTVQRVEELDRQIAAMRVKQQLLADLLRQQLPAASVLSDIRRLIPRDVWLTALSVPEDGTLNIDGLGLSYYAVAQLMDNLSTGPLFRAVDLTVVQLERIGAQDVVRFQVNARVVRPQASAEGARQ